MMIIWMKSERETAFSLPFVLLKNVKDGCFVVLVDDRLISIVVACGDRCDG